MSPYSQKLQELVSLGILKETRENDTIIRYIPGSAFELVLALYLHIIKHQNAVGTIGSHNIDFVDHANKFLAIKGDEFFGYKKERQND